MSDHAGDVVEQAGERGVADARPRTRRARRAGVVLAAMAAAVVAGLFAAPGGPAGAATVSCTHTAGDTIKDYVGVDGGSFDTAANWSPSGIPSSVSIVCIPVGKTVVMGANRSVGGVNGQGGLTIPAGITLTVSTNASSVPSTTGQSSSIAGLSLSGTLGGTMPTDLTGTATLSGSITGAGAKTVTSGSTASITGLTLGTATTTGSLKVAGTATWSGFNQIYFGNGALLEVLSGGVLNAAAEDGYATSDIHTSGTLGRILVDAGGLLERKTSTGTNYLYLPLDNNGTVRSSSGNLYDGGGNSGALSDAGTWNGTTGTIQFASGTRRFATGAAITGANGVEVSGATLATPTATPTAVSNLKVTGGSVTGSQTILGSLDWQGGSLSSAGTTLLDTGSTATAPSGGTVDGAHILRNKGTFTWGASSGYLNVCDTAQLENASGGVMNIASSGGYGIYSCGTGQGTFKNLAGATVNKNTATDTTYVYLPFDNAGTVNVNAGTLWVAQNTIGGADTGTWNRAAGTTLQFGDNRTETGSTFTGSGLLSLQSGTANFGTSTPISVSKVEIVGGDQTGNLTVTSTLTWSSGNLTGTGTTLLESGVTATIPSGSYLTDTHVLRNKGTLTWGTTTGYLTLCDSSAIQNASGAAFNIVSTSGYSLGTCGTGTAHFTNEAGGTVNKNTATDTTYISAPFDNLGTVNVNAGTLQVNGPNTSGTKDTGTWNAASGTTLEFAADRSQNASTFAGAGTFSIVGGNFDFGTSTILVPKLAMSSGTLTGNVTIATSFNWTGGNQVGTGTTTIPAGKTLAIPSGATVDTGHVLANFGTATWGPSGYLNICNGATLLNGSGGQFNVTDAFGYGINSCGTPDGTFVNAAGGTVTKTSTGDSYISVPFDNYGTVNAANGTLHINGSSSASSTGDTGTWTSASGKALTFDGGLRKFNGGTIGGSGTNTMATDFTGDLTISKLSWQGGTFKLPGTATVTGSLTMGGATLEGKIVNQGTTTWGPTGYFALNDGALFENASGGSFVITSAGGYSIYDSGTTGRFQNDAGATVTKTTAPDTTYITSLFDNDGTVAVNAGTLSINGPSTTGETDAGAYTVASGKSLEFSGSTRAFAGSATVTGPGSVKWNGSVLSGSPTYSNTTVDWTSGNIAAPGTTTIGATATLNWNGGATLDGGTISNLGTTNWVDGYLTMGNDAKFLNSGLFDVKANTGYGFYDTTSSGPLSKFTNQAAGTFRKAGTSTSNYVSVPFHNDGNVAAQTGTLQFNGPLGTFDNFSGTTLTGGTYTVTKTLQFTGANVVTNAATIVLNSGGAIQDETSANALAALTTNTAAGTLTLNTGLTLANAFTNAGTVNVAAGTFAPTSYTQSAGTTTISAGATLKPSGGAIAVNGGTLRGAGTAFGNVSGNGTVSPGLTAGAAGKLTETGAYSPGSSSTLAIDLNGAGTAGTNYDQLAVSGAATLNGTLAITTNFTPVRGQTFTVATFGSRTGTFSSITGRSLAGGLYYDVTYNATNVTLTVVSVPGAPTIGSVTRGDTQVTVNWTAPADDGGTPVTGYVVTPYIGATAQTPVTFNSTAVSQTITGLTNGTAYTFKVAAKNLAGTGAQSGASASVTPATVPGAPTIGTATAGDAQATVTWTAPSSNGGDPVTGYVVTPYIGATAQTPVTFNSTAVSQTVTGLTNGTAYTFKVAATNTVGTGAQSAASNSVTPQSATLPVLKPGVGSVTEGNSGDVTMQVPITLLTPSSQTVTVKYQSFDNHAAGVAAEGIDYTTIPQTTLTFLPGETTKNVTVTVHGDTMYEPPLVYGEWAFVRFFSPTNATVDTSFFGLGIGVIVDDDPVPTIKPGIGSVVEGNSGTKIIQVPVTLTNPSALPITVDYTNLDNHAAGVATPGVDYIAASGTVTFAPGETSKLVDFTVIGDTVPEAPLVYGEWILVPFSNPTNATLDTSFFGLGIGVIVDDD